MLKVSSRTAIRFYIILVFFVFARELYTAYSPEGEKYKERVIEIYNQMEYPSNTHIVSYDIGRRDMRRWLTIKISSPLSHQEVLNFYDNLFQSKGAKREIWYNKVKDNPPFYIYKISDHSVSVHPLEDNLIQITITLDYHWDSTQEQ